jgi:hypothetical protein
MVVRSTHHYVGGFYVSVDELLLMHRSQTGSDLRHNFQRQLHFDSPRASDEMLESLSLHELHRIEVTAPGSAQVLHRGDVRMVHLCRRPGLAQKSELSGFVTQISLTDDLQGHGTTQINVERLVGHTHCPTTQLDRPASFVQGNFIVLESPNLRRTF